GVCRVPLAVAYAASAPRDPKLCAGPGGRTGLLPGAPGVGSSGGRCRNGWGVSVISPASVRQSVRLSRGHLCHADFAGRFCFYFCRKIWLVVRVGGPAFGGRGGDAACCADL